MLTGSEIESLMRLAGSFALSIGLLLVVVFFAFAIISRIVEIFRVLKLYERKKKELLLKAEEFQECWWLKNKLPAFFPSVVKDRNENRNFDRPS